MTSFRFPFDIKFLFAIAFLHSRSVLEMAQRFLLLKILDERAERGQRRKNKFETSLNDFVCSNEK